jgi:hypothetical protein
MAAANTREEKTMAASELVFEKVTEEQYKKLAAQARAAGIAIEGASGKASKMGVQIQWNYVASEQRLTLQCLGKPFYMSMDEINSRLRKLVEDQAV